jgi:hypothetical protein
LPGLRALSRSSPSTPRSAKRCCHRHTAGWRHRQHRQAIGRQENNPSPLNVFLQPVAIANDRSQSHAILVGEKVYICPRVRIVRGRHEPEGRASGSTDPLPEGGS